VLEDADQVAHRACRALAVLVWRGMVGKAAQPLRLAGYVLERAAREHPSALRQPLLKQDSPHGERRHFVTSSASPANLHHSRRASSAVTQPRSAAVASAPVK